MLKLLLIEDEKDLREIAKDNLSDLFEIDEAENGFIALDKLSKNQYTFVITDLRLGAGPDGLEILKTIASKKFPSIEKVIFCSSLLPDPFTLNALSIDFLKAGIELHIDEKLQAYTTMRGKLAS